VRHSPITPDIKLVNAALPNQTAPAAMSLYQMALDRGLVPDVYTYSSLITVLSREQRTGEACRTFLGMLSAGVLPDQHVVCSMITALRSHSQVRRPATAPGPRRPGPLPGAPARPTAPPGHPPPAGGRAGLPALSGLRPRPRRAPRRLPRAWS